MKKIFFLLCLIFSSNQGWSIKTEELFKEFIHAHFINQVAIQNEFLSFAGQHSQKAILHSTMSSLFFLYTIFLYKIFDSKILMSGLIPVSSFSGLSSFYFYKALNVPSMDFNNELKKLSSYDYFCLYLFYSYAVNLRFHVSLEKKEDLFILNKKWDLQKAQKHLEKNKFFTSILKNKKIPFALKENIRTIFLFYFSYCSQNSNFCKKREKNSLLKDLSKKILHQFKQWPKEKIQAFITRQRQAMRYVQLKQPVQFFKFYTHQYWNEKK